jgi:HK97 family phage prohead protease
VRGLQTPVRAELVEAPLGERRPSTGSGRTDLPSAIPGTIRFAGYAAIFNRIDKGGDIIRPGAFGEFPEGQSLPLLWQHDPRQHIGWIDYVREDRRGLRVIGIISTASRAGREAADLLARASVKGLSFGYRVTQAKGKQPRELLDLDVAEISLVSFPMQQLARVHLVQQP